MANNPIQSHDLYTPGPQDTLSMLKKELVAIQDAVRALDAQARLLKKTLSTGATSPAKVVAAATEAERIASAKRLLLIKEQAQAQRIANQTMKQAAIGEQQLAAATSRANVARQREINLVNKQTTATKSHASSVRGLLSSIRSLAVAYFSLGAASQVLGSILRQTKALDTLTVAFNTTLGSAEATAQAQEFLLDITERFGANLLGASQAYLKFSAASTQAGVSAEETQKIFTSVTKASSILGLGAERTGYVFLALEQIMSKGRLSTEELRRQLGEHLPGAFGIAAEAMGVTTAKLTDMLKKGEIASTDFLPKFAKQLEIAYGIDQVNRIDNLAAAQERFNNELTLLVQEFNLSETFKDFFNTLAEGTRWLRENIDLVINLGQAVLYMTAAWAAWRVGAALSLVTLANMRKAWVALNAAMKANPVGIALVAFTALASALDALGTKIDGAASAKNKLADATKYASDQTAEERIHVDTLKRAYEDANATEEDRLKILKELQSLGVTLIDQNKDGKISINELTASTNAYVQSLKDKYELEKLNAEFTELLAAKTKLESKKTLPGGITGNIFTASDFLFGTNITDLGKSATLDQMEIELKAIEDGIRKKYEEIRSRKPFKGGVINNLLDLDDDEEKKKGKDPRIIAIDRLIELNKLQEDSLETRLAAVTLANEKEKIEQAISLEKNESTQAEHNEFMLALEKQFRRDLFQVQTEWYDEEIQGYDRQEERTLETVEKLQKFWKDYYDGLSEARKKNLKDQEEDAEQEKKAIDFLNDLLGRLNGTIKKNKEQRGSEDFVGLFELLGVDFKGDKGDQAVQIIKTAEDSLFELLDLEKEIIDQRIDNADRLVAAAENNLNRQIQLAAANQANNVAGAQAELALAKKTQEEALKQRKNFQKQQLALDTALQAQNMVTAITAALKLGPILGPIAVAALIATFISSKIKALSLINKKTFRKGGFREIGGGSHESGNDTHVGDGNYAERNESVGIFTAKATRKYKPSLKAIVNAANKGTLENILVQDRRAIQGINMVNKTDVDTSLMEKRLTRLVRLSEGKTFVDGKGRLVKIDRGRTTIINK